MTAVNKEAVFCSWLEKKNKEYRIARLAQEKAYKEQQQYIEYKIRQGKVAYEKWLKGRLIAEEEIYREIIRERQRKRLSLQEREKKMEESTKAYEQWKARKSAENKKINNTNSTLVYPPPRAETPSLPGYCSVWSCDPCMTVVMTTRVKRPLTYTLTESPNYIMQQQQKILKVENAV